MNTEWKPIASAPKDGTEILAWREDCGQFIASYTSADTFPMTQDELDAWDEETLFAKDWFTQWPQALRLEGSEVPTLWQPMPEGPSKWALDHEGMENEPQAIWAAQQRAAYEASRTPAPTSHPIPTGATGEDEEKVYHFEQRSRFGPWIEVEKPTAKSVEFVKRGAPAAGDALAVEDQQYLHWMIAEECRIETLTLGNGTRYRVHWPDVDEYQAEWFFSPGGAIRAAIAQQKGEA